MSPAGLLKGACSEGGAAVVMMSDSSRGGHRCAASDWLLGVDRMSDAGSCRGGALARIGMLALSSGMPSELADPRSASRPSDCDDADGSDTCSCTDANTSLKLSGPA